MSPEFKAKMRWRCRRGMLELDLILGRFVDKYLESLGKKQLKTFEYLLHCTDPELYAWLMGHAQPVDKELYALVEYIRICDQNR
ncbi:succinate dehydrogenase assembly factor 2 [Legionella israelensis]|nr:succinate dehydrogenase assembly factor 2 [Legionella israelensis]QBS10962.1 succinate dehydrogenase assembly factor 2 family protein [Legionella israelensis]